MLDHQGLPIPGLYAAGNEMASIMGGSYPGAGITIGPAATFWLYRRPQYGRAWRNRRSAAARRIMNQENVMSTLF
ncbi:3-oxosteroid 1-dehydrogenase [Kluyvera cryocrescens]|uniref:3-oxosteroid 1-dehydrogenase n=1 Tax=Kluyvera cryocrescens TaxID=580 RepID=A0A485CFH3_KLUCR|nr:3-oxosteroid 1-dehydrogenase [Kluyvera cryocrescens]